MSRVAPMPRVSNDSHLRARKESADEDAPPAHDTPTPTYVGRPAAPQLLCAYHSRVSALCRGFRAAFSDLPRASGARAGPYLPTLSCPGETGGLAYRCAIRVRLAVLLSRHPGTPGDAGVYRASPAPLHAADHPQSSRGRRFTDRPAQSEAPRHPHHALCGG